MPERPHPYGDQRRSRPRAALDVLGELRTARDLARFAKHFGGVVALLPALVACDQGVQHNEAPATAGPIHIVSSNVGPNTPLPADGHIEIAFDRLLNPDTVTRQTVVLVDAYGNGLVAANGEPVLPVPVYDPVTRVVSLYSPLPLGTPWLTPTLSYTVLLGIPKKLGDGSGIQAIDGATLDPAADPTTRQIGFYAVAPAGIGGPPAVSFCDDVLPVLQLHCGSVTCHGTSSPSIAAEGLMLDSAASIRTTALAAVAHESASGAFAGGPQPPSSTTFGTDMAIVTPGAPALSYLVYKLLLGVPATPSACSSDADCASSGEVCAGGTCSAPEAACDGGAAMPPLVDSLPETAFATESAAERAALGEFIIGREMPYPLNPGAPVGGLGSSGLTLAELERLQLWIAQGAILNDCLTCGAGD